MRTTKNWKQYASHGLNIVCAYRAVKKRNLDRCDERSDFDRALVYRIHIMYIPELQCADRREMKSRGSVKRKSRGPRTTGPSVIARKMSRRPKYGLCHAGIWLNVRATRGNVTQESPRDARSEDNGVRREGEPRGVFIYFVFPFFVRIAFTRRGCECRAMLPVGVRCSLFVWNAFRPIDVRGTTTTTPYQSRPLWKYDDGTAETSAETAEDAAAIGLPPNSVQRATADDDDGDGYPWKSDAAVAAAITVDGGGGGGKRLIGLAANPLYAADEDTHGLNL